MRSDLSRRCESPRPIRVMVIEDHDHVRWGLMKLIVGEWPRMALTSAVHCVEDAESALRVRGVDVVVLDIFLEDVNALDRLPRVVSDSGAAFVILTGSCDHDLHRRAFDCGAAAVVLKDEPAEVLLRRIVRAHNDHARTSRA
jgi:DNA-binding NarL/FixJ family response regulator